MKKPVLAISALVLLVSLFVGIGVSIPSRWKVEKSVDISASPTDIVLFVNNLKFWPKWAPWKNEKNVSFSFEGPESGEKAVMMWSAAGQSSTLKITETRVPQSVIYQVNPSPDGLYSGQFFIAPYKNKPMARLTWTVWGDSGLNLFRRWSSLGKTKKMSSLLDAGLAEIKGQVDLMMTERKKSKK